MWISLIYANKLKEQGCFFPIERNVDFNLSCKQALGLNFQANGCEKGNSFADSFLKNDY